MRKRLAKYTLVLFWAILVWSCEKGFDLPPVKPSMSMGVFIVNEGNYMFSNASLSYYNPVDSMVENKVFYRTNGFTLGDVAQSMFIYDSLGFVVVNNSARVDVINIHTFAYIGTIDGLGSPRYVHVLNAQKGYITDLYAKTISVFNPQTLKVEKTISVTNHSGSFYQHPTEQMVVWENQLFTNCWSFDNKVLIIDIATDTWTDSIETGVQPVALQIDTNGRLWVLTDGGYPGNPFGYEKPRLQCFNARTKVLEKSWAFDLETRPRALALNGARDTLYVLADDVWQLPVVAEQFPSNAFIANHNKMFYALGVDPITSEVYVSDAIDYLQAGVVYRYSPHGELAGSFKVGLVPGWFCFK